MCDPNATRPDGAARTGAQANAPHAGRWFPEAFKVLIDNAYPPADEPAGPPPPPAPPRDDCVGLDPAQPLVITQGSRELVDLGCEAPIHVEFSPAIASNIFVENTGSQFDITIEASGTSQTASGFFSSVSLPGVTNITVIRNESEGTGSSVELRY